MAVDPNKVATSNSSKAFVTSFVANVGLLSIEVGAFAILKARMSRIYSPRTYLPPPAKRAHPLPASYWRWLPAVIKDNPEDIIHKNGLDAYMFLRFIKMLIWVFTLFTIITMAVIVPLDTVGFQAMYEHKDLDKISWLNISDAPAHSQNTRYAGHIIVAYLLTFAIFWLIRKEMLHFVHVRHKYLNSKFHSKKAQARTVLVTSVPDDLGTEHDMRIWASFAPGGIDRIWLYYDTKLLNKVYEDRENACWALETVCEKLLREATLVWKLQQKAHKHSLAAKKKRNDTEAGKGDLPEELPLPEVSLQWMFDVVPPKKRPTTRTGTLGILGRKVESYEHYKSEIARLSKELEEARQTVGQGKFMGSAFIRTNIQMGATVLAQCVSYHEPGKMVRKEMETNPKDIVWANLDDGPLEMQFRKVTSWVATIGLIIGWIPAATFIGALSNAGSACAEASWLKWICDAPAVAQGIITGILPPLLLAIVFGVLPFILRGLAWYECVPRYSLMSISVYRRFYLFLLIHGFLIVTLSSGLAKAATDIVDNPATAIQTLASKLPGASTFFLTYIVTQGLSGAATALLQLFPIVLHYLKKFLFGRTPRQAFSVTFVMPLVDFGLVLPRMSLLATIGFTYSVLTPFINVMALVSFVMFYIAWKYLLTQVMDQPDALETAGLYYPMAMQNLFVGLYIEHVCLACLFFLKASKDGQRVASIVQGICMIVLFLLTIFYHIYIKNTFDPITYYLPMSMATQKLAKKYVKDTTGIAGAHDDLDLFAKDRFRKAKKHVKLLPRMLDNKLDDLKAKVTGDEPRKSAESRIKKSLETAPTVPPLPLPNGKDAGQDASTSAVATGADHTTSAAPLPFAAAEVPRPPSVRSNLSLRSNASKKSKASKDKEIKAPSHPVFDPPAPALSDSDNDSDNDDSDDEHAFDHPATYKDQPFIWIPEDTLGLSKVIIKDLEKAGVYASDLGSTMNRKGIVEVTRGPPDEDWEGGHDH